jgi:hypothetical protein
VDCHRDGNKINLAQRLGATNHPSVANHNDYKGVIMADHDIQKSQHLLKSLKEQMSFLNSLLSQAEILCSNLQGTWTAIRVTHGNWIRDIEEIVKD